MKPEEPPHNDVFPSPVHLRAWRSAGKEPQFVDRLRASNRLTAEEKRVAGLLHGATFSHLSMAQRLYTSLLSCEVTPQPEPLPPGHSQGDLIRSYLWGFLQAAKAVLDSIGREINLVYWSLDDQKRFFDPLGRARWTSFYTVRQKLLLYGEFRADPVSQLLKQKTMEPIADRPYRNLSHLVNVGLSCPLILGPIERRPEGSSEVLTVAQYRVWLPDDPRTDPLTYAEGFEINATGQGILLWLNEFVDEVYAALTSRFSHA